MVLFAGKFCASFKTNKEGRRSKTATCFCKSLPRRGLRASRKRSMHIVILSSSKQVKLQYIVYAYFHLIVFFAVLISVQAIWSICCELVLRDDLRASVAVGIVVWTTTLRPPLLLLAVVGRERIHENAFLNKFSFTKSFWLLVYSFSNCLKSAQAWLCRSVRCAMRVASCLVGVWLTRMYI